MKSKMENWMESLEEKVTHTVKEVTGRISGVEETVQNLQREVDKLPEMSLKPTLVASSNACWNIKPPVYDGKTSWQIYNKQFEALFFLLREEALEVL